MSSSVRHEARKREADSANANANANANENSPRILGDGRCEDVEPVRRPPTTNPNTVQLAKRVLDRILPYWWPLSGFMARNAPRPLVVRRPTLYPAMQLLHQLLLSPFFLVLWGPDDGRIRRHDEQDGHVGTFRREVPAACSCVRDARVGGEERV